jgi:hypothetical protein
VKEACQAWCDGHKWIDGDGNQYRCDFIAWRATGAASPILGGCTEAGIPLPDLQDLRTLPPRPVQWTDAVNVTVDGNTLTRQDIPGGAFGGAASTALLQGGDGYFEFTATETTTLRLAGFAVGGLPDLDPSFADIDFGVLLREDGTLLVFENGASLSFMLPYAAGARIRVAVVGGVLQYFMDEKLFYTSPASIPYPLRVSAALVHTGATIANAHTSF